MSLLLLSLCAHLLVECLGVCFAVQQQAWGQGPGPMREECVGPEVAGLVVVVVVVHGIQGKAPWDVRCEFLPISV